MPFSQERHEDNLRIVENMISKICPSKTAEWLLKDSDFLTAPASTKFHGDYKGGLLDHSLGVIHYLARLVVVGMDDRLKNPDMYVSLATIGLLHDVCKIGVYQVEEEKMRTETGEVLVEKIRYKENYPLGHGEKSCDLLAEYDMKLSREERLAVRWHMGAYGLTEKELLLYSQAVKESPLVFPLHTADMMETLYGRKDNVFLKNFLNAVPF